MNIIFLNSSNSEMVHRYPNNTEIFHSLTQTETVSGTVLTHCKKILVRAKILFLLQKLV